jgi:UDP-3-O-[3-hydroxymyristoyl] glucosamine N-acyltransferase
MQFTAKQISDFLSGTIEGDENVTVSELSKIEDGKKGALCFLSNRKYEQYIYSTEASVVIVGQDFFPAQPVNCTLVKVKDPYSAFSVLLEKYNEAVNASLDKSGIEQPSFIHPSARIGKNVFIGAFSYISENAEIGDNTKILQQVFIGADAKIGSSNTIHPGVKVYNRSVTGDRVVIHSNIRIR